MKSNRSYIELAAWAMLPFIVYCYFINWRTNFIYGDDINIYMRLSTLETFQSRVNMAMEYGKFRPVQGLVMQFLFDLLQKNILWYFVFNISVQVINIAILSRLLRLFIPSTILSIFCSLIVGLSRFCFFNITQLYNGGALEGLAMSFFLLSLYFILRALVADKQTTIEKGRYLIMAIVGANLAMYTHERYVVLFPFLLLVIGIYPGLKTMGARLRAGLSVFVIISIVLNVVIKKYVYGMAFFMGTSGTEISFSFSRMMGYFLQAVISIFQVNSGPGYLTGIPFTALSSGERVLVLLFVLLIAIIIVLFIIDRRKAVSSGRQSAGGHGPILLLLGCLFGLLLLPAVVTIRLEQRWLQASMAVFVIMTVIAITALELRNRFARNGLLLVFFGLFLWTDHNYIAKGADSLYMMDSERLVTMFYRAIRNGVIRDSTKTLYIWEQKRDENTENAINWDLGGGAFFDFYQGRAKRIVYVDSLYEKGYPYAFSTFRNLDPASDQIIYIGSRIVDITSDLLKDSLNSFLHKTMAEVSDPGKVRYDQRHLSINGDDLGSFNITGIFDGPGGVHWMDGNVSIGMRGSFLMKDSATVIVRTYRPAALRNTFISNLTLDLGEGRICSPSKKIVRDDSFIFQFEFYKSEFLQSIHIVSDTTAPGADGRRRSLPFISCEIKQ